MAYMNGAPVELKTPLDIQLVVALLDDWCRSTGTKLVAYLVTTVKQFSMNSTNDIQGFGLTFFQ